MSGSEQENASGTKRQKVVQFVLSTVILVGRCLPLGIFFGSRHVRVFPKTSQAQDADPQAFVPAKEFHDPDEDQLFHDLRMSFAGDCLKNDRNAGHKDHFEDRHWGYSKGLIEGELDITDVDALPAECQAGLFAKNGRYPVVSRPNFLHDGKRIKVSRLSLKLQTDFAVPNVYNFEGHAQELDLLLSEGVDQQRTGDQDGQGFFFRDARQLRYLSWLQNRPFWGLFTLLNSANSAVFKAHEKVMHDALDTLYAPEHAQKSWEEKDYYSAGPYALNGVLVKYALRSRQDSQASGRKPGTGGPAQDQGAWFSEWQAKEMPAVFDLCVQVARYGAIPTPSRHAGDPCKAVMATEYTDLVWDESVSPFDKVGTLTLQPAPIRIEPRPWYFRDRDRWYPHEHPPHYALRFNAWNTLPEMAPVGQLFRARKQVHAQHRDTRLRHTFGAKTDPDAMCPVAKTLPSGCLKG